MNLVRAILGMLAAACCLLAGGAARAQAPSPAAVTGAPAGQEEIDDPKVARRLKTRAVAPASSAAVAPVATSPPPPSTPPSPSVARVPAPIPPLAPAPSIETPRSAPAPALAAVPAPAVAATPVPTVAGEEAITRRVEVPEPSGAGQPNVPRLKLGLRRFSFVRVGASDGPLATTAASEPFNVLSLDYYPASSIVRFGLSAQYGAESGKLTGGGDYFLAQTFSLGMQFAGNVFTPFAEAFAGAGYMRRLQFQSSVPTAYWQFGVDVGTEIFMSRYADVSVALGYIHPVDGFTRGLSFTSVYVDTWSLKLGFGF